MSRHDEARAYLESWEPDDTVLPDWIVDELEASPELQALFDRRFEPWQPGELAAAPVRAERGRRWLVLAPLLAAALVGVIGVASLVPPSADRTGFAPGLELRPPSFGPPRPLGPDRDLVLRKPPEKAEEKDVQLLWSEPTEVTGTGDGIVDLVPAPDPELTLRRWEGVQTQQEAANAESRRRESLRHEGSKQAEAGERRSEERLRAENGLPSGNHRVEVKAQQIEVGDQVSFDLGSTEPTPESEPVLDAIVATLAQRPDIGTVVVEGHSEPVGTPVERQKRALERAEVVRKELVAKGVAPDRLRVQSWSDQRPIVPGDDARNGRVELRIDSAEVAPVVPEPPSSEEYTDYGHHSFHRVGEDLLSTFSIDVDTASYSLVRRKLTEGYLPPVGAVRVEEFVNAMPYEYPPPPEGAPFGVSFEGAPNPFNPRTELVRVAVQGRKVPVDQRRSVHLTFLVDTSGSMQSADKLGLAQYALMAMTRELVDGDTVAIVTYAGSAGVVLPPTAMSRRDEVLEALSRLQAGGSTAMGEGIGLAYQLAEETYRDGAVNRVIIVSDGDANVGVTDPAALTEQIRGYARKGITLTVAGFGDGNYKDTRMEQLADDGDGNYWYVDSEREAQRVFVDRLTSTLVVIGKDVKIQVEWNPATVEAYRLIGYENRDIADRDFRNDAVDAGEIGAGHQVTALYEVARVRGTTGELGTVRVRNKAPGPDSPAVERSFPLTSSALRPELSESSAGFRIAVAAASFAELLRGSPHLHGASYADVAEIARGAKRVEYPEDLELIGLIDRAAGLAGPR